MSPINRRRGQSIMGAAVYFALIMCVGVTFVESIGPLAA